MPKISVIVPIYGVEKYIERCANSLFGQTFEDMEFIFINDCTTDNSMGLLHQVLDNYPSRKPQTIICDMPKNCKLAAARNRGLSLATGDYVIHCDSDDWVDADLYQSMYEAAISTNSEIVICPIKDEYIDHTDIRSFAGIPGNTQSVLEHWYSECIGMFAWNKMVRRTVYTDNSVRSFDDINMWEDNGLMMRLFYFAKGLSVIDNAYYHYNRSNSGAMTTTYGEESVCQMIRCASLLDDFFKSKPDYQTYEKTMLSLKFYARINLITDSFKSLRKYYSVFPESRKIIPFIPKNAFSRKGWIRFCFARYNLEWLFVFFYKLNKNFFHIVIR